MCTNGSRVARSTPAKARRTGKPSPSRPLGAVVTDATGRSTASGPGWGTRGRAIVSVVTASDELSRARVSIWARPVRSWGERREVPARHEEDPMGQDLLSVHSVEGEVRDPMTDEEMQQSHKQVGILEQEMKSAGAWLFSGRLHEPATATVVRMSGGE